MTLKYNFSNISSSNDNFSEKNILNHIICVKLSLKSESSTRKSKLSYLKVQQYEKLHPDHFDLFFLRKIFQLTEFF